MSVVIPKSENMKDKFWCDFSDFSIYRFLNNLFPSALICEWLSPDWLTTFPLLKEQISVYTAGIISSMYHCVQQIFDNYKFISVMLELCFDRVLRTGYGIKQELTTLPAQQTASNNSPDTPITKTINVFFFTPDNLLTIIQSFLSVGEAIFSVFMYTCY